MNPTTNLYFIQQGSSGPIKIGVSNDPERRLRTLQTSSIMPFQLLRAFPAGRWKEKEWHRRFRHLRIRGEWFHPAPELLAAIFEVEGE